MIFSFFLSSLGASVSWVFSIFFRLFFPGTLSH
jgi:hypothetical protein